MDERRLNMRIPAAANEQCSQSLPQMKSVKFLASLLFFMQLTTACALADTGVRETESASAGESVIRPGSVMPLPAERRPAVPVPPPPARPAAVPTPPTPITTCDAGGCWNANGGRYNGGPGNTYMDRNGRLCQRNGAWMRCY